MYLIKEAVQALVVMLIIEERHDKYKNGKVPKNHNSKMWTTNLKCGFFHKCGSTTSNTTSVIY
jgi:hypothetical protein